jgi:hypothetical protein
MLTSSIKLKRKGGELAGGLPAYTRPTLTKRRHVPGAELIAFFRKLPGLTGAKKGTQALLRDLPQAPALVQGHRDPAFPRASALYAGGDHLPALPELQVRRGAVAHRHRDVQAHGDKDVLPVEIIKRWKANCYVIAKKQRPPRLPKLTSEQDQSVLSPETLQDMSHLSLKRLGLASFADHKQWEYCRRLKVKYKRPGLRFSKSLAENRRLKEEQHAFVMQLDKIYQGQRLRRAGVN